MENLVIKQIYYDKFYCLKDACPNTCCKDWKINIDNKTLKKYNNIKDKNFSKFVVENINASTNNVVLNKKVCPFLDDDCLCKIQKKCGENYLCKTCKSFPRFTQKNKNLTIYNLYLSCPNTFKLLQKYHNQNKYLKKLISLPININLKNYLQFQNKINKKFKYNILKQFQSFYNYLNNKNFKKPQKNTFEIIVSFYKKMQQIFNELEFSNSTLIELKKINVFLNYQNLSSNKKIQLQKFFNEFSRKYKKQLSLIFNYYLNNFTFKCSTKNSFIQNLYKTILLFYMCKLVLFLSYLTQNKNIDFSLLTSVFSKTIEHSNSLKIIISKIKDLF